jgi:dihydrofolate synthase/folylpolyglutamate synthase
MDVAARLEELYRLRRFGIKLGLGNVRTLLGRLGNPQERFPAVHVAGTNGKGSVCALVASVLREAGYAVGLYTSPHLVRFHERIVVNGEEIGDADILRLYDAIRPHMEAMGRASRASRPTFFEVTTAMAFEHFAERDVDVAVVEAGMGGRMDATNVVRPAACVLTRMGLEHTEHLGRTVRRIAREKAGIFKEGVPAVAVEQEETRPVVEARARDLGCPLTFVPRDVDAQRVEQTLDGQRFRLCGSDALEADLPLLGAHQLENAALAYAALRALAEGGWVIPPAAVVRGFRAVRWPARLQVVRRNPLVVVDGMHNPPAAEALAAALREILPPGRTAFVLGVLADKDLDGMAAPLAPHIDRLIVTRPRTERACDPEEVAKVFAAHGHAGEIVPDVAVAVDRALEGAGPRDAVVVTGSLYTAGEALAHLT